MEVLIFLAIGGLAGFLAGKFMKTKQSSLFRNIVLGVVGSVVGGFLFGLLGINAGGLIGSIIVATLGAAIVIYAAEMLSKK